MLEEDNKIVPAKPFSRRDFLKVGGLTMASFALLNTLAGCDIFGSGEPGSEVPSSTNDPSSTPPSSTPPIDPGPDSFVFYDSLGRQMVVPKDISKVAIFGSLAQIVTFPICADNLIGLAGAFSESARPYIADKYFDLPVTGQFYVGGGSSTLNKEEIASLGPQILIDCGEPKANMAEDLDSISQDLSIPVAFIACYLDTTAYCYHKLGELLGKPEKADEVARYCERIYARTKVLSVDISLRNAKTDVLYVTGSDGLSVLASPTMHTEVFDLLVNNIADISNPSSSGNGNAVNMEQIYDWDPGTIIFAPGSIYSTVKDNPLWSGVTAIKNNRYYEVPNGPYNWFGGPPSVQRYLCMIWLAQLLYPSIAQYNVYDEVKEYFKLFYNYDLTQARFNGLLANSLGKQ
ncbi:MAG: ABC transporter substrate-binding protein [Dehalococcoidia bacterium]|nr:ABC transporter substrate-binding protein [Dehalococcoidia bacterium]